MSNIDARMHSVYKHEVNYTPTMTDVRCRMCGTRLKAYYAEEKLYAVKCGFCEYIGLVKTDNPTQAMRFFGEYAERALKGGDSNV